MSLLLPPDVKTLGLLAYTQWLLVLIEGTSQSVGAAATAPGGYGTSQLGTWWSRLSWRYRLYGWLCYFAWGLVALHGLIYCLGGQGVASRLFHSIATCLFLLLTFIPFKLLQGPLSGIACAQGVWITLVASLRPELMAWTPVSLSSFGLPLGYGILVFTKNFLQNKKSRDKKR